MRILSIISITILLLSCKKHEKRIEGSWFVNYFVNDTKTEDFTLKLDEGGSGKLDGATDVTWSTNKKDLSTTLFTTSINEDDGGVYVCTGENAFASANVLATVNVLG